MIIFVMINNIRPCDVKVSLQILRILDAYTVAVLGNEKKVIGIICAM